MIFEGTEKKVEIIVSNDSADLRSFGSGFWSRIVEQANACILSSYSNGTFDAHLLSESSLFVYKDRMIMITCGRTNLANATLAFIDAVTDRKISYLIYERKNENFPHLQPTSFDDDIREINSRMPGVSTFFGDKREHYLSLFHIDREYTPVEDDTTVEVLMYDIAPGVRNMFAKHDIAPLGLSAILPGFTIDDHVFSPMGYSLNAVRGRDYYTIHVTPEEHGSYVSFETNVCLPSRALESLVRSVTAIFMPDRFDCIVFNECGERSEPLVVPTHHCTISDAKQIGAAYDVQFLHFRAGC